MRDPKGQEGPGEKGEDGKGGKYRDNQWRLTGWGDVHVDGHSTPG